MSERILVVGPYPPRRDGIGSYAVQQVRGLRAAGHHVEVCSPWPSAAHHHLDLVGPRGGLALARLARRFDRMVVHFHQNVFFPTLATPATKIAGDLALGTALRAPGRSELLIHEINYAWAFRTDPAAPACRWMLAGADEIQVHATEQRHQLIDSFGMAESRVRLIDHGEHFQRRTSLSRPRARISLGLREDRHIFLCIGFVQAHKGFDRAARAFARLPETAAELHVVGSVRVDDPDNREHLDEIEHLARTTPGVHLHLGYVGDERFDRWIVAADVVVLPYRYIWSSGVMERAALYDRPVVASAVGGLGDQVGAGADVTLVADDSELIQAMAEAIGARRPEPARVPWPETRDAAAIQDEVTVRATERRGGHRPITEEHRLAVRAGGKHHDTSTAGHDPVADLDELVAWPATSARPGVSAVKAGVRRLIGWEVDPIRGQLARLQRAVTEALGSQTARIEALERALSTDADDGAAEEPAGEIDDGIDGTVDGEAAS